MEWNSNNMQTLSPKICPSCNKEFTPYEFRKDQIYCCTACYVKGTRVYKTKRTTTDKVTLEFNELDIADPVALSHERFHHTRKGCLIKGQPKLARSGYYVYSCHCETHNVEVSRTSWEWGWYGGIDSNKLK